jgi:hypothetical protein
MPVTLAIVYQLDTFVPVNLRNDTCELTEMFKFVSTKFPALTLGTAPVACSNYSDHNACLEAMVSQIGYSNIMCLLLSIKSIR